MPCNNIARLACCASECRCLECEAGFLVDVEHDVHILHRLSYGTLEQVVNHHRNDNLASEGVKMYESLVCVYHLLQVRSLHALR